MSRDWTIRIRNGAMHNDITARNPDTGAEIVQDMSTLNYSQRKKVREALVTAISPFLAKPKKAKRRIQLRRQPRKAV
jgi:hypothetical protein